MNLTINSGPSLERVPSKRTILTDEDSYKKELMGMGTEFKPVPRFAPSSSQKNVFHDKTSSGLSMCRGPSVSFVPHQKHETISKELKENEGMKIASIVNSLEIKMDAMKKRGAGEQSQINIDIESLQGIVRSFREENKSLNAEVQTRRAEAIANAAKIKKQGEEIEHMKDVVSKLKHHADEDSSCRKRSRTN